MRSSIEDFADFVRDNWFMAVITIISVGLMIYFIFSTILEESAEQPPKPEELPKVPDTKTTPLDTSVQPSDRLEPSIKKTPDSPTVVVPIRPAQIGHPNIQAAKEAAFDVINSVKEVQSLPDGIKIAFVFFIINPDGSRTDIPESNLSFTIESRGRIRMGIGQESNVRIKMPASRLEDLKSDFCQTIKDMAGNNEIEYDISSLPVSSKFGLISAMLPVARRCGENF